MSMTRFFRNSLITVAVVALTAATRADEAGDKGRDIFQKNKSAVVTVQVVQKVSGGRSGNKESKQDISGTVIDANGLTVIALSSADPSGLYRRLSEEYKMEIEVSEIRILQEDGSEIPAEIVLRDKDLDLAFLRPKTKLTNAIPAIGLSNSATAQVLEEVIALNRLKRAAGRSYAASVERVASVVHKPRTFYVLDGSTAENSLGSPIFALNGNLVGILVMRAVNAQGVDNWRDCLTTIVLPAEDIAKGAAQAPEAKPPSADDVKKPASKRTNAVPSDTNAPAK